MARGRRCRAKAGAGATPSGAGTSRCGARWWRQAARTHRSAATPSKLPSASRMDSSTEGDGDHAEDGRRHDVAGGAVAGPQDDPGHSQDGELAGGQVGEQPVLALDIGGDAHPTPVPGSVMLSTGHSATPAASALTPL